MQAIWLLVSLGKILRYKNWIFGDYWRSNNRSCRELRLIDIDWARRVKVWRLRPRTKHTTGPEWKPALPRRSGEFTNPWTAVSAEGLEATIHPGSPKDQGKESGA